MSHDQLMDSVFVEAQEGVVYARRRAQAHQLKAERSRLISNMINWSERVSKIDSLLYLLDR